MDSETKILRGIIMRLLNLTEANSNSSLSSFRDQEKFKGHYIKYQKPGDLKTAEIYSLTVEEAASLLCSWVLLSATSREGLCLACSSFWSSLASSLQPLPSSLRGFLPVSVCLHMALFLKKDTRYIELGAKSTPVWLN